MNCADVTFAGVSPSRMTPGSHGFDLSALAGAWVKPWSTVLIDTGVRLTHVPEGVIPLVVARSSLWNHGLMLGNGVGVIDRDYAGPTDTIKLVISNMTDRLHRVNAGDRLAQLIFVSGPPVTMELDDIEAPDRGGFGSTGEGV